MMSSEIFGLLAGTFEVLAIYLVGKKKKAGFAVGMACNVAWITYVAISGNTYGLVPVCIGAFIMNIKGFRNWKNEEKQKVLQREGTKEESTKAG